MRALAFIAACSSIPLAPPVPARIPLASPGIAWQPHPAHWHTPAVLCVSGTRLTYSTRGWGCL